MENIINLAITANKQALSVLETNKNVIKKIACVCVESLRAGGKIIFMGNGGSASDAQHLAAELTGRFYVNRKPLAAIAITANTSEITAIANDFGYDQAFVRQIEALTLPKDIVIGISTSGESANVVNALGKAKEIGAKTVGFLGKNGGQIKNIVDIALIISDSPTPRVQEMHILAGHIICEIIEKQFT